VDAPLGEIPLYLREAGVVPVQEPQQWVGEKKSEETVLHLFPAGRSAYELYEDDGVTHAYRDGAYAVTRIETEKSAKGVVTVRISRTHDGYDSGRTRWLLAVRAAQAPSEVAVGGGRLAERGEGEGYRYDGKTKTLYVRLDAKPELTVTIR